MNAHTYRVVIAAYPVGLPSYVSTVRVIAYSTKAAEIMAFNAVDTNLATYQHIRKIGILRRADRLLAPGTGPVVDHTTYDMDHERF